MPMIGVVMVEMTEPNGSLYSGLVLTPARADALGDSVKLSARWSGTKTSFTMMSLLPVPRRPTVSQTSSMV